MFQFMRNFQLDRVSFWLGFLAATLFWWLILRFKPNAIILFRKFRIWFDENRAGIAVKTDVRLRNDVLTYAEKQHLAAALFSLDEIIIQPLVLAPPLPTNPDVTPPIQSITEIALPYTPDWPEFASHYKVPTLTLAEALQNGANLILIGNPGSGKTVALAHLAIQLARRNDLPGNIGERLPIFIQAVDLLAVNDEISNIDVLILGVKQYAASVKHTQLKKYLPETIENRKSLLIIDGLDELPPELADQAIKRLAQIATEYPELQYIISASLTYIDGLPRLGAIPVAIADWDVEKRTQFVRHWSRLWYRYVGKEVGLTETVDPGLLNAWLLSETIPWSPLEMTLKSWALYAGDVLGPSGANAIEAFIRRASCSDNQPDQDSDSRHSLQNIALDLIRTRSLFFKTIKENTTVEDTTPEIQPAADSGAEISNGDNLNGSLIEVDPLDDELLGILLENGLIQNIPEGQFRFSHSIITAYLAGCGLSTSDSLQSSDLLGDMIRNTKWDTLSAAAEIAAIRGSDELITNYLAFSELPLEDHLLSCGKWLRNGSQDDPWRAKVLSRLANVLKSDSHPFTLKVKALTALVTSNSEGIDVLLRQLASSEYHEHRQLAALGSGYFLEDTTVEYLIPLLQDPSTKVRAACCLALVALGTRRALEALADTLLHGDEELRRYAAEAFANNMSEGYPTLKEGSTIDDLMVRRAVIFGLKRVNQPWAIEILKQMQAADDQWAVKDLATTAIDELEGSNLYVPNPLPTLQDTPWLIKYAGESGEGISQETRANDYLLRALKEGSEEQKLAAIERVYQGGYTDGIPELLKYINRDEDDIGETAYLALWYLASSGADLTNPDQASYLM